jgi:hypothetical protein
MSIRLVNLGRADKGDGDPLRVAFDKINKNFTDINTGLQGLQGLQSVQGIQGIQGLQGANNITLMNLDLGSITPNEITTPIELLFYTSIIDIGKIGEPYTIDYDAGTL